jgi:N-acetylmuramoyl-L-alanine amidase
MIKKIIIFCLSTLTWAFPQGLKTIVLDAGHGGKDPGTQGKTLREKDLVLDVTLELGKLLEKKYPKLNVIYTRKDDTFIPLIERAQIANKNKAQLFISIHANAGKPEYQGVETYVVSADRVKTTIDVATRENSAIYLEENAQDDYKAFIQANPEFYLEQALLQKAFEQQSIEFAQYVQKSIVEKTKTSNRSVKQAGFVVLFLTQMPSILIEIGFLSNITEEKRLSDVAYQKELAEGIFNAIKTYKEDFDLLHQTIEKSQNESNKSKRITYAVQIASSKKEIELQAYNFKGLKQVKKIQNQDVYFYYLGEHFDREEVEKTRLSILDKYPDAFIIALEQEKKVSLPKK